MAGKESRLQTFGPVLIGVLSFALLSLVAGATGSLPVYAAGEGEKLKIPDPEEVTLETKDGVLLRCTYYAGGFMERLGRGEKEKTEVTSKPGKEKDVVSKSGKEKEVVSKPGKEVVPIIMLHGWERQRGDYHSLASSLQRLGHAVIVPDLRGHGRSVTRRYPGGEEKEIDREQMKNADFAAMVLDVEACKKFLLVKNNAGQVNIEMLCVIGADMGATVACNWAALDWSRPALAFRKQGRDVKALILLSPQESFKGMTPKKALQHQAVRGMLSMMIVAGKEDREGSSDARAIYNRLERFHPVPEDPKERLEKQDLFLITPDTSLRGTKLLDPALAVHQNIRQFIQLRLVNKKGDFAWSDRKSPLETQ